MRLKQAVYLDDAKRSTLRNLLNAGTASARKLTYARILLKADKNGPGLGDLEIASMLEVGRNTVFRVRQHFAQDGLERALHHLHPQNLKPHRLDERAQAHLIALACTKEAGQAAWSLRMLADKMVELGYVERVSHETVRQTLKKTRSNRI